MGNKLAGFDEAPVFDRLPRFDVGTYVAEVIEMKEFESTTNPGDFYFKATFKILEAAPGSKSAVGDEVGELIPLQGKWKKTLFGVVKGIVGACTGERGSSITYEDYQEAVAADNPAQGAKVKVYCASATKKDSGEEYSRATFVPFRGGETASSPTP